MGDNILTKKKLALEDPCSHDPRSIKHTNIDAERVDDTNHHLELAELILNPTDHNDYIKLELARA